MTRYYEINFDGIVGPTHNYAGLSYGNIASMSHQSQVSNPKEAALQGLSKMRLLHRLGVPQGVLPPHERPYLPLFHRLGFRGSAREVIIKIAQEVPDLLIAASSSAHMWTANAATISPSCDTFDKRVHFTPANLISKFHRSIEAESTSEFLKIIFPDPAYFCHHSPLPATEVFADEGAANHVRLCSHYGQRGLELFVFGRDSFNNHQNKPKIYPARQAEQASKAIARLHQLDPKQTLFEQQNPLAIDQGVFHNDVISTGNENIFLYHEKAFIDSPKLISSLSANIENFIGIQVNERHLSIGECVKTYLFNSQLTTLPDNSMVFIAPEECLQSVHAASFIEQLPELTKGQISKILYINLRESMQNGGGPACLRLRVVVNKEEMQAIKPTMIFNDELDRKLVSWVKRYYRDRLYPSDLADPLFLDEVHTALAHLTQILDLGSVYSFMRE